MAVIFERGLMTSKCQWQTNNQIAKGAGFEDNYSNLLSCWGYLRKARGSKILNNGEILIDDSFELITDFIQNLYNNLRADLQVIIASRVYKVQSWEQMNQQRFYLKFNLTAKDV